MTRLHRWVRRRGQAAAQLGPAWWALWVVTAAELFAVQQATLDIAVWRGDMQLTYARTRLLLDLAACGALLAWLPVRLLPALFAIQLPLYGALLAYFRYYDRALSIHTVLHQAGEGADMAAAALSLLGPWTGWLAGLCGLKVALWAASRTRVSHSPRRGTAALFAASYAAVLVGAAATQRPLSHLRDWADVGAVGYLYGYTPTWLAELYYRGSEDLLARALARGAQRSDRLSPHEAEPPLRRNLVFLQVESLDYLLLDFALTQRGERLEVTPELNALKRRSMFYKVRAPKTVGSCDADFTALMGRPGSADVPTYRLEGYPYDDALVHALNAKGMLTEAYHGVSGRFFHRRHAFERMGFDRLTFREELAPRLGLTARQWCADDRDVLRASARALRASARPAFQLVITATSHVPFNHTPPDRRRFFPARSAPAYAYLDAMHYVDAAIGEYVRSLPADTTLVIYGDHWSRMENPDVGYVGHELSDGYGMVPVLIYNVGEDLHLLQRTRETLARSGALSLQDIFTWLHRAARAPTRPGQARAARDLLAP